MRKLLLSICVVSLGLSGCVSTQYSKPINLRFQDKSNVKTQKLNVLRDHKLCHDDTADEQNCPVQFYIDDIKTGTFYINNAAQYFLKSETYNFKVKNCTDECTVCETELNPAEIKDQKIVLSVDGKGLPLMLNTDQQLICEVHAKQLEAKDKTAVPEQKGVIVPIETTTQVNLAADTLFKFDGSSLKDLLPKGHQEVVDVANKITSSYASVRQINLVGHTDRLGNDEYNQRLGQRRAETVREVLVQNGVPRQIITTKSAGETMPVTNGCYGVGPREALKACLQPDRRVSVEITGIAK